MNPSGSGPVRDSSDPLSTTRQASLKQASQPHEANAVNPNVRYEHVEHRRDSAQPSRRHLAPRDGDVSPSKIHQLPTRLESATKDALSEVIRPQTTMTDPTWKHPTLPDEAFDNYKKAARLQDKFLTVQSSLKSERDTLRAMLDGLTKSQSQLLLFSDPGDFHSKQNLDTTSWRDVHAQVMSKQEKFHAQTQLVSDLEQSLGKLEYRLAKLHPQLLAVFDAWCKAGEQSAESFSSDLSDSQRASSPSVTSLEQEYYDRRGDVRLLQDQLVNHHTELQTPPDGRTEVATAPTLGTEDSGSHFHYALLSRRWETEHEALQRKLHNAEQEMQRVWKSCQVAGLKVGELTDLSEAAKSYEPDPQPTLEDLGTIELDSPPFLPHNSAGRLPRFLRDFRWPQRAVLMSPLVEELTNFAPEKRALIEQWVGKIPSRAVEFDHAVSTPRSDPDWSSVHKTSDDVHSRRDYVMVANDGGHAPNGEALKPGKRQRSLRPWKSDVGLRTTIALHSTLIHRGSDDARVTSEFTKR